MTLTINGVSYDIHDKDGRPDTDKLDKILGGHMNNLIEVPESGIGDLSDGYHTFNELYHHRAILFSVICNQNKARAWKSKLHHDGTMYDGMFIVGIETNEGSATYHYDIEPYWDYFKVRELSNAPVFDGHTPDDAINRLYKFGVADYRPNVT